MKKLAEFSVNHPLLVNLLTAFIVIAGLISLTQLKREAFPEVSFDVVTVNTPYRGAMPEEVERLVTTPLEKELKTVDDIEEMSSISIEGLSTIVMEIDPDAKNKRKIIDDIQTAVDRMIDLPVDSEKTLVTEITSKQFPVIIVSVTGDISESKLQEFALSLEDRFLDIDGVASVKKGGFRDREFWVELDLDKMKSLHVSFDEVAGALYRRNIGLPAGKIQDPESIFSVKTKGEFHAKVEVENVVIRSNDAGIQLKIKDAGIVTDTFEEQDIIDRTEGYRSISLVVVKREKADTIKIVDQVKKITAEFKNSPVKVKTFYDMSYYIRRRLNVLNSNGVLGFVLVSVCLFVFLHAVPAFFTAWGIPVALLTTFALMNLLGLSINLITMFGLIIVLGMLVDDGIIICENIYRYIERGMAPKEAAIKGAAEVMVPVLSTVATTIVAFLPLVFMSGLLGRFMRDVPIIICLALTGSIIESFIVLPSHMADFAHPKQEEKEKRADRWFKKAQLRYSRLLEKAINSRYKVSLAVLALFIAAIVTAVKFMPFVLFSSRGVEQFMIRAEGKIGTPLEKTEALIKPLEKLVETIPREYMDTYHTQIGILKEERAHDPESSQGTHLAQVTVYLTPEQQRKKSAKEIIEGLRPKLSQIEGFEKMYFRELKQGPPTGKPIELRIKGDDYTTINKIVSEIKDYLNTLKGVQDITDGYILGNRELHIVVDEERAASAYVSIDDVARTVRAALEGWVATTIKPVKAEEEIKVRLRLNEAQRSTPEILDKLIVANRLGNLIPLKEIARIEELQGIKTVRHVDGRRFVYVSAEVDNKNITSAKANRLIYQKFKDIPQRYPGYTLAWGGEAEEAAKSMRSLLIAFLLATVMIYIILASQFNSLLQPFVVMLSIPFSIIGVVFALKLHNEPMGFLVILGLIGLTGVIVNDSIVLMDFINRLRSEGKDRRESIIEAAKLRLRPIMLTSVTTILGVSTVAYGIGGKDPFLQPMALTFAWGLLFATSLTLIVIPCIRAILDDAELKFGPAKESITKFID
ncbi:MAG: efflux RND transporter permease subunit [Candidatus Omnitrophota bacterium]|nr:efflux RND transporter permease subunit [Candidatus Omnitrophota bacterium]